MRINNWMAGVALSVVWVAAVQAQTIGGIAVNPTTVKVGEPVTVTATIDVTNSNYCGFTVGYGDGSAVDGVSDVSHVGPFVTSHTYAKPGSYQVTIGGRNVQSHPNCGGKEEAVTLTVTPAQKTVEAKGGNMVGAQNCTSPWKLTHRSSNARTGAFSCSAKAGTAVPDPKPVCKGDLTYFENVKKGQYGCRP